MSAERRLTVVDACALRISIEFDRAGRAGMNMLTWRETLILWLTRFEVQKDVGQKQVRVGSEVGDRWLAAAAFYAARLSQIVI